MIRRHSDFPLENDASSRFLPWMIAFMVYLAILALAAAMIFGTAVSRWGANLAGTLTVQIAAGPKAEKQLRKAIDVLETTPGVASSRVLTVDETRALLDPWLGPDEIGMDLPIPRLIDVRISRGADIDMKTLNKKLKAAAPNVVLEDHRKWLSDLISLVNSVKMISAGVVMLTMASAILTVVFAARTGLAVHHHVIELMHLIGARDRYVARQFQYHALLLGLRGGLVGLILAGLTLFGLAQLLQALDNPILPKLALTPLQMGALVSPAIIAALIAMFTARVTVLRSLDKIL